jgi:outer membrane receptor protein involved in Fe transport
MQKMSKLYRLVFCCLLLPALALAQGTISGKVTDSSTKEPLIGASVLIEGTTMGAATGTDGTFSIANVPAGSYRLKVSFIGYIGQTKAITAGSNNTVANFALESTVLVGQEVIVEVNRARERETPAAFTTVKAQEINEVIHGQDAPLLTNGTPGVYAFSTDGVGHGEAKLYIRGFNQDYVQVLINGVPTNDPESNRVYWSNWGSVSAAAANIQVQRGAGSSLYGAGAFGGSFNIVTQDAPPTSYYGLTGNYGDPKNTLFGVKYRSGLINEKFALAFDFVRKIGEGSRRGGIYKGVNYYLSGSWYINEKQSLKMVLHGAPQEHSYSWTAGVDFFKKHGYDANPSPYLARSAVNQLPASGSGLPNFGLLDGRREVVSSEYVGLAHNHFHKPQLELHYNYDFNARTAWRATFFYSKGSGGGSSLNGQAGTSATNAARDPDGVLRNVAFIRDTYLVNAYQRDSFSLHRQFGLLTNIETQLGNTAKVTLGGEVRSWRADHPGFFTNLYGKTSITDRQYAWRDPATGLVSSTTFRRRNYEGDIGHKSDTGSPFGWDLDAAVAKDPTFRTQYRNYLGETPQFTLFGQANWRLTDKLNVLGTLQYVWYQYKIKEYMPSENAIGVKLPLNSGITKEGPDGNGKFYMEDANVPGQYYEFVLVDETRRQGFLQPKGGVNYNLTDNLNVFGSVAHVERFVDLGVFYNAGLINPAAEDEKSNQFEFGFGWQSANLFAKVNAYYTVWQNKAAQIVDPEKAGFPGYSRNGERTELVGESTHRGLEFEMNAKLDQILPVRGLSLRGAITLMDNKWTDVLESVKFISQRTGLQEDKNLNGIMDPGEDTNNNNEDLDFDGTLDSGEDKNGNRRLDGLDEDRRIFNSGSSILNARGARDAIYFVELKDTHVANQPQTAFSVGLNYRHTSGLFASADLNYYARDYTVDGGAFRAVDGSFNASGAFVASEFSDQTPSRAIVDAAAGYRFNLGGLQLNATAQVLNVFDKEYFSGADGFGFYPGALRTFRINLDAGF